MFRVWRLNRSEKLQSVAAAVIAFAVGHTSHQGYTTFPPIAAINHPPA